ncbi:MAG: glycosyltransferase family 4 protein [Cyanosarcina radialis HA8281-LM2]|jgi:glycosyltransferase involved in cell wall biosynthesis|nr:glycosyltransferase family 4 protein [Cyanosarcina radialis HA8281-LM2]
MLTINLAFLMQRPTGTSIYAVNLLPHLSTLAPTLLVSQQIDSYACYPVPANQTSEQGWRGHLRRLRWTRFQLPKIYQELKASLLFSPIPEAPIASQCRFIVTVHDLIPLRFPKPGSPLTWYCRYYLPQVLARSQHILCDSEATARDLREFFNIPIAKIAPIPLAYDASHFRLLDRTSPQPSYFLYLGRHDPYKNLHRSIEAFAKITKGDCELWLGGSYDRRYTPKLQVQAKELGVSDRVKFLDYVPYDRLPILLNRALALVFPTLWEGFGLPVLEAMACGTPVITSNLSSIPEVAGDAAILIDPYNVEEMAAAMQAVAEDEKLRSSLSALGLQRASQFSWAKTGRSTVEILQKYL